MAKITEYMSRHAPMFISRHLMDYSQLCLNKDDGQKAGLTFGSLLVRMIGLRSVLPNWKLVFRGYKLGARPVPIISVISDKSIKTRMIFRLQNASIA